MSPNIGIDSQHSVPQTVQHHMRSGCWICYTLRQVHLDLSAEGRCNTSALTMLKQILDACQGSGDQHQLLLPRGQERRTFASQFDQDLYCLLFHLGYNHLFFHYKQHLIS